MSLAERYDPGDAGATFQSAKEPAMAHHPFRSPEAQREHLRSCVDSACAGSGDADAGNPLPLSAVPDRHQKLRPLAWARCRDGP